MTNFKRFASLMLALILVFGLVPFFGTPASAATSSSVASAFASAALTLSTVIEVRVPSTIKTAKNAESVFINTFI